MLEDQFNAAKTAGKQYLKELSLFVTFFILVVTISNVTYQMINVYAAHHLTSPIMVVRRRFFKYFSLSLLGAIGATLIFIVVNGWLAEWTEP